MYPVLRGTPISTFVHMSSVDGWKLQPSATSSTRVPLPGDRVKLQMYSAIVAYRTLAQLIGGGIDLVDEEVMECDYNTVKSRKGLTQHLVLSTVDRRRFSHHEGCVYLYLFSSDWGCFWVRVAGLGRRSE